MFQSVYESPWHNPASFFAINLVFAAVLFAAEVRRRARGTEAADGRFLRAFLALFLVEISADAWLTGGWSPLPGTWLSSHATGIAIAFVILGDFRYFLLVERFAPPGSGRFSAAQFARALALAFVVPVASLVLRLGLPNDQRVTFLAYEVVFACLATALRFVVLPRRLEPGAVRQWLLRVTSFEIVQYVLWALADVVILAGMDWGFALRLVPNTLYYAGFLPFVFATAPREFRS